MPFYYSIKKINQFYIFCVRVHRISCDASENQSVIRRLKNDKERLERSIAQEKEQHRQTHNKVKTVTAKLKAEKDEVLDFFIFHHYHKQHSYTLY